MCIGVLPAFVSVRGWYWYPVTEISDSHELPFGYWALNSDPWKRSHYS